MRLPPRGRSQIYKARPAPQRSDRSVGKRCACLRGHGSSGGDSRVQCCQQAAAAAAAMATTHAVSHLPWAYKIVLTCAQGLATVVQCHYWGDVTLRIAASLFRQDDRAAMASRRYGCAKTTRVFTLWGPARDQLSSALQCALRQRHTQQALAASLAEVTQADTTAPTLKAADMLAAGKIRDAQSKHRGFCCGGLFDWTPVHAIALIAWQLHCRQSYMQSLQHLLTNCTYTV